MLHVDLHKTLGVFQLDIRFEHGAGILILFGRSGAGKSTTLRMIAGIDRPTRGRISFDKRTVFSSEGGIDVSIQRRSIGFIFQHPSLFPHMTAYQNIAYAAPKGSAEVIERWLAAFHAGGVADRYPHQMSGGEQQRIAIVRALVTRPKLLLMDEPLSAVDIATRNVLLDELRDLPKTSGIPIIYVTHNISEAYRLGDRVLVLEAGRVIHDGVPLEVFHAPTSVPLASLYGTENMLRGEVVAHHPDDNTTDLRIDGITLHVPLCREQVGETAMVAIRPEDILVAVRPVADTSARNQFRGRLVEIEQDTAPCVRVALADGPVVRARITHRSLQALALRVDSEVHLLIKAWACHPIDLDTSPGPSEPPQGIL